MKPLAKLYSHATELPAKARRDRDALRAAADAEDERSSTQTLGRTTGNVCPHAPGNDLPTADK